jgi:arginine metabolism regulation protein II
MEGSMSEYWIHLDGLELLARQLRNDGKTSTITDRLIANSSFLSTVASTTSIELPSIPWEYDTIDSSDVEEERFNVHNGLEVTYGITYSLARLMRRIVARSQNIAFYVSQDMPLPTSLIAACSKLSDDISEWSIDSEPLSELFVLDSERDCHISLQLARSHLLAFAHSLRVYYHTRILPCSSSEMSHYVEMVAHHLMTIESIKSEANYDSNVAATITWPGFIASCEAKQGSERDVWCRWWNGMLRHRIGNIPHLWNIVQKAWSLRDDEGSTEVPGWIPALRATGKRVLAI